MGQRGRIARTIVFESVPGAEDLKSMQGDSVWTPLLFHPPYLKSGALLADLCQNRC